MSIALAAPLECYAISEDERSQRCQLSSDRCVIDGQQYFILGNLEIGVIGSQQLFIWSLWAGLSEKQFERAVELWDQRGREAEPAYPAQLSLALPSYPDVQGLASHLHTKPVGIRPNLILEPLEHRLFTEQREGITLDRVKEIVHTAFHGQVRGDGEELRVELDGSRDSGPCSWCGQNSRTAWGWVHQGEATLASYFVHWTLGRPDHGANFDLIIGEWGESSTPSDRKGISLLYRLSREGTQFTVIDANERPIAGNELVGTCLTRDEVLGTPLATQAFAIVDEILYEDGRIAEILGV